MSNPRPKWRAVPFRLLMPAFRRLIFAISATLVLAASPARSETVTSGSYYWGSLGQDTDIHSVGYTSAGDAAAAGAAYYCSMPQNQSYFQTCGYGGIAGNGYGIVATEKGAFAILPVTQYQYCPVGTQAYNSWIYLGVTYAPACVDWSTPPPPPPPPPKAIVFDPGHGYQCLSLGMPLGAVGSTVFPANDPPPGRLREEEVAMSVAGEVARQLPATRYKVVLTKRSADECPSYSDRAGMAKTRRAVAFISVHANAPVTITGIFPSIYGTSAYYHTNKPGSSELARLLASNVSTSLGLNNSGAVIGNHLLVLQLTPDGVFSVLLETARLSGKDEVALHTIGSSVRIASAIKASLDSFFGN